MEAEGKDLSTAQHPSDELKQQPNGSVSGGSSSEISKQISDFLIKMQIDEIPKEQCNEIISCFIKLQSFVLDLALIQDYDKIPIFIEANLQKILNAEKVSYWAPFEAPDLWISPIDLTTKQIQKIENSAKIENVNFIVIKSDTEKYGLIEITMKDLISESLFSLLCYFSETISTIISRICNSFSNCENIINIIYSLIQPQNITIDGLKYNLQVIKSNIKCDSIELFWVLKDTLYTIDGKIDNFNDYLTQIKDNKPKFTYDTIIYPTYSSKNKLIYILILKNKTQIFTMQTFYTIAKINPILYNTIKQLFSKENNKIYYRFMKSLTKISEIISNQNNNNNVNNILNIACNVFICNYGVIYKINENEEIKSLITIGFNDKEIETNFIENIIKNVIKDKKSIIYNKKIKITETLISKSTIISPILNRNNEIIGIIQLIRDVNLQQKFTENEIIILQFFSSFLSNLLNDEFINEFNNLNKLITKDINSIEFINNAKELCNVKSFSLVKTKTNFPIIINNEITQYIQIKNENELTTTQQLAIRTISNIITIKEELNKTQRQIPSAFSLEKYLDLNTEEELIGIPNKLKSTKEEKQIFNTYSLYIFDLTELQQIKLLFYIFKKFNLFNIYQIKATTLLILLITIKNNYQNNPYHAWCHAVDVLHFCYIAIQNITTYQFNDLDKFILYFSTLSHDLGHLGFSSKFLIKTQNPLSLINGENSILEKYHLSIMLKIFNNFGNDILNKLNHEEKKIFWETSIHIILMTDMDKHNKSLEDWDEMMKRGIDINDKDDKLRLMAFIVQNADISNSSRPFDVAKKWAERILLENFMQGDIELELGLGYSSNLTNRNTKLPNSQIGFISGVCAPMFKKIAEFFPELSYVYENAVENVELYKQMEQNDNV